MSRNPTTQSSSKRQSTACSPASIRIRVIWIQKVFAIQVETRGEFGGLGMEVTMEGGLLKVIAPIDDTPAVKADVMANDIITKLDNEPVHGLTLNQAVEKMRGPVYTRIKLTIMRKGQDKPIDVSIVRDVIRVKSVRSHTEGDDVGYIRVTQFNEQTTEGLKKAISDLTSQL